MVPNSQLKPALLMTMLMLLSIALAPVSDWSRVIGDERTDEREGQSADGSLLEPYREDRLVQGDCVDILVVPVTWAIWSNIPHRYSKPEALDFMENDVSTFVDIATYGAECAEFIIADEYQPSKPKFKSNGQLGHSNSDGRGATSNLAKEIMANDVSIGDALSGKSHKDLADAADILAMIENRPGHGGQATSANNKPVFVVRGYNAFENPNGSLGDQDGDGYDDISMFLCDDTGRMDLSGSPVDTGEASTSISGHPQARCYKRADFLSLFGHELLHAMGVGGHGAAMYKHCHDIMGDSFCSGPVQPSSWVRTEEGWFPEGNVVNLQPSWDVQNIKLRPLNLNLLGEISTGTLGSPNADQIQILEIPLSDEADGDGNPDPINYLLVEYRPRITLDENGNVAANGIGQADNLPHCRLSSTCWSEYDGLPTEGVMIYSINERWNFDPNTENDGGTNNVEPIRVVDANQGATDTDNADGDGDPLTGIDPTMTLMDAAWTVGQEYTFGIYENFENEPYKIRIKVVSLGKDAELEVSYESPEINNLWGQPDAAITFGSSDEGVPWITADIWVDSSTNNYDVDNLDGDNDPQTGIDAVYRWHADGDVMTPQEHLSDPPIFDEWNWIYARVRNEGTSAIETETLSLIWSWRKPTSTGTPTSKYFFIDGGNWNYKLPICPPTSWMGFCEKNLPQDSHIAYSDNTDGTGSTFRNPYLKTPDTLPLDGITTLFPGEEYIIGTRWKPLKSDVDWVTDEEWGEKQYHHLHACLDVRAIPVNNEPFAGSKKPPVVLDDWQDFEEYYPNNWAYENVPVFQVSKGSPYEVVDGQFDIWNSFPVDGNFTLELFDIPTGMSVEWSPEVIHLDPGESGTFHFNATLSPEYPLGVIDGFDVLTWGEFDLEGDVHRIPIKGGLRIMVETTELVEVEFDVTFDGGAIIVDGTMVSQGYTLAGENYAGSVVALKYYTPEGISILRPALLTPGSGTTLARFDPGSSIDISYVGPLGREYTSSRTMDTNGEYMDSFSLDEQGDWTITYTYTSGDGSTHEWFEVVNVPGRPISAPIAEGYEKISGIGVFQDVFTGTAGVPLNDGNWNVRVLFAGDSIHRSTMTTNQSVRVEGMAIVHPEVDIGDIFVLDGIVVGTLDRSSSVSISYLSPSATEFPRVVTVDSRDNSYRDHIVLDEGGLWIIIVVYTNDEGETIESRQSINVRDLDVGSTSRDPVVERITRDDTVRGDDVTVGGRLNSTSATAGTTVTIRAWSPSGVLTTRDVTTDEDLRFENTIKMGESGRWTIEYEYTDDDGNVMSWGEAIDVEDTEEKDIFTYESGVILAVALIILTGLLLVARGKRNRQDD